MREQTLSLAPAKPQAISPASEGLRVEAKLPGALYSPPGEGPGVNTLQGRADKYCLHSFLKEDTSPGRFSVVVWFEADMRPGALTGSQRKTLGPWHDAPNLGGRVWVPDFREGVVWGRGRLSNALHVVSRHRGK